MADIRAFRGLRYDLGRAGPLSDLVAPPYDVIDAALQEALYDRSAYNEPRGRKYLLPATFYMRAAAVYRHRAGRSWEFEAFRLAESRMDVVRTRL